MAVIELHLSDWSELLSQVALSDSALSLPVMPPEQVCYLLSRDRQVLAITRLEESEVVLQCTEAFHVDIDTCIQVYYVDLGDLVQPLELKLALQSDNFFHQVGEFVTSLWLKA